MGVDVENSWAVITPSYRGDFARCRLLCQSMDSFVSGAWIHYIIVEKVDLALFRSLAGPRRTILEMEALLPSSFHHLARIPNNQQSQCLVFLAHWFHGWLAHTTISET